MTYETGAAQDGTNTGAEAASGESSAFFTQVERALKGMSYSEGASALSPGEQPVAEELQRLASDMRAIIESSDGATTLKRQTAFMVDILPDATLAQITTGVPTSITMAQAAQETGYGGSPTKGNNFFGIKGKGPAGSTVEATTEEVGGQTESTTATFRAYENRYDSFIDHGKLLSESPTYADAMAVKENPHQMAKELQKAGYATDSSYASSLSWIMSKFSLVPLDGLATQIGALGGDGLVESGPIGQAGAVLTKESLRKRLCRETGTEPGAIATQDLTRAPTRAEAVTMFFRAFRLPAAPEGKMAPFADVPPQSWYTAAANSARYHGLFGGFGDNTFRPAETVGAAEVEELFGKATTGGVCPLPEQSTSPVLATPAVPETSSGVTTPFAPGLANGPSAQAEVSGTAGGAASPGPAAGDFSRAQFLRMVLFGSFPISFSDGVVMALAQAKNLVKEARPNDPVTRAEAALILARRQGIADVDVSGKVYYFFDLLPDSWEFQAAHVCRLYGIFHGHSNNCFGSHKPVDRATATELIRRTSSLKELSLDEQKQRAGLTVEPLTEPSRRYPGVDAAEPEKYAFYMQMLAIMGHSGDVSSEPGRYTLVGVRGFTPEHLTTLEYSNQPGVYDDAMVVIGQDDEGAPFVREYPGSTDPGKYEDNVAQWGGVWRMKPGAYEYQYDGKHPYGGADRYRMTPKQYNSEYSVQEDTNGNDVFGDEGDQDLDQTGKSWYLIHQGDPDASKKVGQWSVGCQVIAGKNEAGGLNMDEAASHLNKNPDKKFNYILIDGAKLKAAMEGGEA